MIIFLNYNNFMRLNIGCGNIHLDDCKNIDISKTAKADEVYDVSTGIREEDDSCEEIICGCMLEQLETNKDFVFVLNECWRVLKSEGILRGYVPSTDPRVMYLDPMDKRFFQEDSFKYFLEGENPYNSFGKNYGFKPWRKIELRTSESGIIHFALTPVK